MQILSPIPLSMITAATALVASITGPVVTLAIARREFQANIISASRQKWIDTFRARVSELLSLMNAAQLIKRHSAGTWRGGIGSDASQAATDKVEKAFMALSEVRLLTNVADPDHQRLNKALATALAHLQDDELRQEELEACIDEVIALGRMIIRHEWGRVKRGV